MERTLASTVILKRNKMLGDNTEIEQDDKAKINEIFFENGNKNE